MVDLSTILTGGAASRGDSLSGMQPTFLQNLQAMVAAAPPEIQQQLRITSGFRSPQIQQRLWDEALVKYGSPETARKWVAPPGRSQHGHGNAADMKYLNPAAQEWAHANAANYGLAFPLGNEPWHIELASARGGAAPAPVSGMVAPGAMPAPAGDPSAGALMAGLMPSQVDMPIADSNPGGLAALFTQDMTQRQARREDEQRADQIRKQALFGGSLFG